MKQFSKTIGTILGAIAIFLPLSALAFSGSEVAITKDGAASITSVKVMQLAGPTFFARMYWGDAYVRLTIRTDSKTKFYRATGEQTTLAEISEGDWLNVAGVLASGTDILTLQATSVTNTSVEKKQSIFSGKVLYVDVGGNYFTLSTQTLGTITVRTNSSTRFVKGSRFLDLAHVSVGDTISKAAGDYDIPTQTLVASTVVTYIDPNYYKPKNFQGTLTEIDGSALPTSIKVSIAGTVYTVNLTAQTYVLNNLRNPALLSRFVTGDTIRIYGAIREVDGPIIDAQIVRNISL